MVMERLNSWFTGPSASLDLPYQWFCPRNLNWPWKAILSKSGILPKHRISFWLFAHRKFLTRDRQVYIEEKRCVLCGLKDETFDHLYFECTRTNDLWCRIKDWLGLKN